MTKLRRKCWKDAGWERGDRLTRQEGNQAHTFLARKTNDAGGEFKYILKTLKRQEDPDRRAMFFIETRAMSAVDHGGVLQVEATNCEDYKDDVELYLITRRVDGRDLEQLVSLGLAFEDAIRIVIGVLKILDHCHKRSVIHRDVKPCHVLVSEANYSNPVLIDFGLAYGEKISVADAATKENDGKGNRFLIGPEHLAGRTTANRSPATDICQAVGLLFYATAGRNPGILLDENQQKPHARSGGRSLPSIPNWKQELLTVIFDKAFEWHPDDRWNEIPKLVEKLSYLLETDESPEERLRCKVAKVIANSTIKANLDGLDAAKAMSIKVAELVRQVISTMVEGSKGLLSIDFKDQPDTNGFAGGLITFKLAAVNRGYLTISLVSQKEHRELVVKLKPYTGASAIFPDQKEAELGRFSLGLVDIVGDLRETLEEKLLVCMQECLEID